MVKKIAFRALRFRPLCFLCKGVSEEGDGYAWKQLRKKERIPVFVSKTPGPRIQYIQTSEVIDKSYKTIHELGNRAEEPVYYKREMADHDEWFYHFIF